MNDDPIINNPIIIIHKKSYNHSHNTQSHDKYTYNTRINDLTDNPMIKNPILDNPTILKHQHSYD